MPEIILEIDGEIKTIEEVPPGIGRTTHRALLMIAVAKTTCKRLGIIEGRAYSISRIYPIDDLFWCSAHDESGIQREVPDFCFTWPDEPGFLNVSGLK